MSAEAMEAVPTIAALIASGLHLGFAAWTRAATPATCGEAIQVPDSVVPLKQVPPPVETKSLPAAETSGLAIVGRVAAEANGARGAVDDRERAADREVRVGALGVGDRDVRRGREVDLGRREGRQGVLGGDRDRLRGGGGRSGEIGVRAGVAGR